MPNKFATHPFKKDKSIKAAANVDWLKSMILAMQVIAIVVRTNHTNHEKPKKAVRRSPFLAKYRLNKKANPKVTKIDVKRARNGYKYLMVN